MLTFDTLVLNMTYIPALFAKIGIPLAKGSFAYFGFDFDMVPSPAFKQLSVVPG